MATPRANGNPELANQNYTANVVDSLGMLILPPVRTYGPRGIKASWGYDKNGSIVETGWSKKIDLYRIINDTTQLVSARIEAIDTRAITLIADARTFTLAFQSYADAQKEIDSLYAMIPVIFSLGLSQTKEPTGIFSIIPGVFSVGVTLLAKNLKPDDYKIISQQLKNKLITLESEIKGLQVLRSNLTGEYAKFDELINDADRSANLANNWIVWLIVFFVLFLIIKRSKRR